MYGYHHFGFYGSDHDLFMFLLIIIVVVLLVRGKGGDK